MALYDLGGRMNPGSLQEDLVAPLRSADMPPSVVIGPVDNAEISFPTEDDLEPGHLLQARALTERAPKSPTAWARLAQAEMTTGSWDAAVTAARQAILFADASPDPAAVIASAQVLSANGQSDEAEAAVSRLPDHFGSGAPFLAELEIQRGDLDAALKRLKDNVSGLASAIRGWIFLRQGHYPAAVRELRSAAKVVGGPEVFVNLGCAYALLASHRKAIRASRVAVGLAPGNLHASFNLTAYLLMVGDVDEAITELGRISRFHPRELKISFARAQILAGKGDWTGALRELQRRRVRADNDGIEGTDLAELDSNLSYLEYKCGRRTKKDAASRIHHALVQTGHTSLGITYLLASLITEASEVKKLSAVREAVLRVHAEDEILPLSAQLALLEERYDDAVAIGRRWTEREPLNAAAFTFVTFLLSCALRDHAGAARFGLQYLRRFPRAIVLANDVSYSLAMSGDLMAARRVLPPGDASPLVIATRGLISVLSGDVETGIQQYRAAAVRAEVERDTFLAALIRYRADLLLASLSDSPDDLPDPPAEFRNSPGFLLQRRAAKLPDDVRERARIRIETLRHT